MKQNQKPKFYSDSVSFTLRGYLKLKNGDVREFVDHIHHGDELWFLYDGKKFFLEREHNTLSG